MNGDVASKSYPIKMLRQWPFAALTEVECIDLILRELDSGRGGWVVTVNLDIFRRLLRDQGFAFLCRQSTLLIADGMPLVWASRLQGTPLPERVAGSSLLGTLSAAAARHGRSIFMLGGERGTAEESAEILRSRHSDLQIKGTYCPKISHKFDENEAELIRMSNILSVAQPDIVYVALGSPKQEIVINQLRGHLPGAWWLGVGISFSYLSGRITRAPMWARQAGLEWIFRMVQEPRRLVGRYLWDNLPFCAALLAQASVFRIRRTRLWRAGARQ